MRTILITGPGGAGRTTVAAATALATARAGGPQGSPRTLLLSTDRTDTLGQVLGTPTGPRPVTVEEGLTALRPDPAAAFRDDLLGFQRRATTAFDLLGTTPFDAEELTPLPGTDELALLRALRQAATGPYDVVVVDLPAAPGALAALALPEQLRRYLRRLLPPERRAARALHPVLGRLAGVPLPAEWLYETAARWDVELAAVEGVLKDPATTARLVAEPGEAGAAAVRNAMTGLALHGLRLEALIANRLLPTASADAFLHSLAVRQRKTLDAWTTAYGTKPPSVTHGERSSTGGDGEGVAAVPDAPVVVGVPHLGHEPHGPNDLAALALPPVPAAPGGPTVPHRWRLTDHLAEEGVLVWHIPLPTAERSELDLIRRGDELVVTAGQFRRIVELPSALRRCTVAGAGLREGELRIRFSPDPALWPGGR